MKAISELNGAERASLVICVLFIAATLLVRFRPVDAETGFYVESGEPERIETQAPANYDGGLLDVNLATVEELCLLPGIGEVLAGRIIDYREQIGGFRSLSQLDEVHGIGPGLLEDIAEYVTLEGYDEDIGS